jgi:PAS domain S-box-containing protein
MSTPEQPVAQPSRADGEAPSRHELLESEARLRSILASTLDPVVTIDDRGIIQSASDSIERVLGWKPEEIIGRNVAILMPPPHSDRHDDYLAAYREGGATNILGRSREFDALHAEGHLVPIELAVSRADIPGRERPLFTGILRDISERQRIEQELARHREHLEKLVDERTAALEASHEQLRAADRLASIGTLVAGLGHDMNNILFPVRSRLDVLETLDLSMQARAHITALRSSVDYLQQLTDGLHLLALDPDDPDASSGVTELAAWWTQSEPLLMKVAPKLARFRADVPDDLPAVRVAPHRLTQAVLNLVINAAEYVPEGGEVHLWMRPAAGGEAVAIGVTDDGPGMTPEVRRHALEPFFTTKTRGLGTGLGLSLVHGVAKSGGGTVRIESEPGEGTTVILDLPTTLDAMLPRGAERPIAYVTVDDPRLASLLTTMLDDTPVEVRRERPDSTPAGRLWITEPAHGSIDDVTRFLAADADRQVVVCNTRDAAWEEAGAGRIETTDDFTRLRRALGTVLSGLKGPTS